MITSVMSRSTSITSVSGPMLLDLWVCEMDTEVAMMVPQDLSSVYFVCSSCARAKRT